MHFKRIYILHNQHQADSRTNRVEKSFDLAYITTKHHSKPILISKDCFALNPVDFFPSIIINENKKRVNKGYLLVLTRIGYSNTISGVLANPSILLVTTINRYLICASVRNGIFRLRNCSFNIYSYSIPEDWRIRSWLAISVTLPQSQRLTYKCYTLGRKYNLPKGFIMNKTRVEYQLLCFCLIQVIEGF